VPPRPGLPPGPTVAVARRALEVPPDPVPEAPGRPEEASWDPAPGGPRPRKSPQVVR